MTRVVSFILGLALIGIGFLGMTDFVPEMSSSLLYLNIGEIALGIIGLLFGMYSPHGSAGTRQRNENTELRKSNNQFTRDSSDQMARENEQLKKTNEQYAKDSSDQLARENDQLRKEVEMLRSGNTTSSQQGNNQV